MALTALRTAFPNKKRRVTKETVTVPLRHMRLLQAWLSGSADHLAVGLLQNLVDVFLVALLAFLISDFVSAFLIRGGGYAGAHT